MKDSRAFSFLQQAVSDEIFPRIAGAKNAKDAWEILQEEFKGNEKVRTIKLQSLRREFENLKMKESETSKTYYSKIKELVNQMRAYGEEIPDKRIVEKILITVTDKFDPIVTTIESTKDLSTLSVTELMGSLEAYEQRLSRRNEDSTENAFQSRFNPRSQNSRKGDWRKSKENSRKGETSRINEKNQEEKKGKYPPCGICKKTNHLEKDCWFRDKPKCRSCKKFGHEEKNCRLKGKHQANFTEENDEGDLFYACQAASEEKYDT